mmetsp:Transcript_126968/g.353615  ORF Transcript_126968/g.353615 Transcript_126968/m.353615 type:complete len:301 (+) Transcript_126968:109-1011(+)
MKLHLFAGWAACTMAAVVLEQDGAPMPDSDDSAAMLQRPAAKSKVLLHEVGAGTMYSVGMDDRVYKQSMSSMNSESRWMVASGGSVTSIAVDRNTIFGTGENQRVYEQPLSSMTPSTAWALASRPSITAVAVDGDTMYGVSTDECVYSQPLRSMSVMTSWTKRTNGYVLAIAVDGDTNTMYGVGRDNCVYSQSLSRLSPGRYWTRRVSRDAVMSIAVSGGTIYGVGMDNRVYAQRLSSMTTSSSWALMSSGSVKAIAVAAAGGFPCRDNDPNCAYWASIGECRNNPNYMLTGCPRSCGQC